MRKQNSQKKSNIKTKTGQDLILKEIKKIKNDLKNLKQKSTRYDYLNENKIVSDLEKSDNIKNKIQTHLKKRYNQQLQKNNLKITKEKINDVFKDFSLSTVSSDQKEKLNYFKPGDKLSEKQDLIVKNEIQKAKDSDIKHITILCLKDKEMSTLGLKKTEKGFEGEIDSKKFRQHIQKHRVGYDYIAMQPLHSMIRNKKTVSRLLKNSKSGFQENKSIISKKGVMSK